MIDKEKKVAGELIFGVNPLVELLKTRKRKLITIYTTKPTPKGWAVIAPLLPNYPVPIQYVTRDVLTRMVETTDHQGIVAWVKPYGYRKTPFNPASERFIIALDGIQDPRNLGALIRSAYCTGADGVIIIQKNSAPLTAVALKASAGLAERISILLMPSAQQAAIELKQWGYTIYTATFAGTRVNEVSFDKPTCLVIGSEGFGVTSTLAKNSIEVTIPQKAPDISYNASVAGGILMYLISSQMKKI